MNNPSVPSRRAVLLATAGFAAGAFAGSDSAQAQAEAACTVSIVRGFDGSEVPLTNGASPRLGHEETYAFKFKVSSKYAGAEVKIVIDGKPQGGIQITEREKLLDRSLSEAQLLTFFKTTTEEGKQAGIDLIDAANRGAILLEIAPIYHEEVKTVSPPSTTRAGAPSRGITSSGGTGLSGKSDQQLREVRSRGDWTKTTKIGVRLVHGSERDRKPKNDIKPLGDKGYSVPPPAPDYPTSPNGYGTSRCPPGHRC